MSALRKPVQYLERLYQELERCRIGQEYDRDKGQNLSHREQEIAEVMNKIQGTFLDPYQLFALSIGTANYDVEKAANALAESYRSQLASWIGLKERLDANLDTLENRQWAASYDVKIQFCEDMIQRVEMARGILLA